jgi:MHS family proline/betaine transporter-like MFS transporter
MGVAIVLMTIGTAMLAVVPPAAWIGIAAPVLVLLARIIQGFSLGGEYGAATAFLLEHDPARSRFLSSFQSASQNAAGVLAATTGWLLGVLLPTADYDPLAFRIAFLLGALIGPVGLLLRRQLDETEAFLRAPREASPVRRVLRRDPGRILTAAGSIAIGTGATYVLIYLPTYASTVLHMPMHGALAVTSLSYAVGIASTLLAARLLETAPRRAWMAGSTVVLMLAAWPLFALLARHPQQGTLLAMRIAIFVLGAPYFALIASLLASLFPASARVTGISIGYTLGVVLFGAFAPLANAWLIGVTHDPTAPAFFLIAMGCVSLVSFLVAGRRETDLAR